MTTKSLHAPAVAPLVREFMRQYRIPAESLRHDGRLTLRVDRKYRLDLVPAPHDRIAIQSQLLVLDEYPDSLGDAALLRIAQVGAGMLQDFASSVCIDAKHGALVLQQTVRGDAELRTLHEAVGDFVNALAFWSRYCSSTPGIPRGRAS